MIRNSKDNDSRREVFQGMVWQKKKKRRNNEPDKRYPPIANLRCRDLWNITPCFVLFLFVGGEISYFDFVPISGLKCQMFYVGRELLMALHGCLSDALRSKVTISKNCQCFVVYFSLWFKALLCERDYVKLTFLVWRRYRG